MKKAFAACVVILTLSLPASAQQVLTIYDTRLDAHDLVNSSGRPLSNVCAVVQQDRANYHRFGRRGQADDADPIFGDGALRAQIGSSGHIEPGYEYLRDAVFRKVGYGIVVRVKVLQNNGKLQILVSERAG